MSDFTDHVGAVMGTERCRIYDANCPEPEKCRATDACCAGDVSDAGDVSEPVTPDGPYSCLHRGHGLCADCPSDDLVEIERDLAITDAERAWENWAEAANERDDALDALSSLLASFKRLSREFSTAEQQACLRRAHGVLQRMGRR